jgi:hypothetical protein
MIEPGSAAGRTSLQLRILRDLEAAGHEKNEQVEIGDRLYSIYRPIGSLG